MKNSNAKKYQGVVAHDADWQFPAITEKCAFERANELLPIVDGVIYFAFPWATLIDKLQNKAEGYKELHACMRSYKESLAGARRIVTVCQHIRMLQYAHLFQEMGVTDIYWTHFATDAKKFKEAPSINIYPFPLYPVQREGEPVSDFERKYLFSFVGARANQWYLTQSRNQILDILSSEPDGFVAGNDNWHFNKVVYDLQIKKKVADSAGLVDSAAEDKFKRLMKDSLFSLCPSGSGPNTIRLWEAFAIGSIPVVLADTYIAPSKNKLWTAATVQCAENEVEIRALPARLREIAKDTARIDAMLNAGRQLAYIYGPDFFVYDLIKLYLQLAVKNNDAEKLEELGAEVMYVLARKIISGNFSTADAEVFQLGLASRYIIDSQGFVAEFRSNPDIRKAFEISTASSGSGLLLPNAMRDLM